MPHCLQHTPIYKRPCQGVAAAMARALASTERSADSHLFVGLTETALAVPGAQVRGRIVLLANESVLVQRWGETRGRRRSPGTGCRRRWVGG